jgi:hypothetical protein
MCKPALRRKILYVHAKQIISQLFLNISITGSFYD